MGFFYILKSGAEPLYKIGETGGDLDTRIKELSTGNPYPLSKVHVIETDYHKRCETHLKRFFRSKRCMGQAKEFYRLEGSELEDLIAEARRFLDGIPVRLQAAALRRQKSDGRMLPGNPEARQLREQILMLEEQRSRIVSNVELLRNRLQTMIGTADGLEGVATWISASKREFQEARLKSERPDLYELYLSKEFFSRKLTLL